MAKTKRDLPPKNMLEIALCAMTKAGHEYSSEWTNTWVHPWLAYEHIYTNAIGQSIKSEVSGCVFFELSIHTIITDARYDVSEIESTAYTNRSRADIAVYNSKNGVPVFCIEVKNAHLKGPGIKKDIERCEAIVTSAQKGSINEAAVVFIAHQKRSENEKKRGGGLQKMFNNGFKGYSVKGLDKNGKLTDSFDDLDIQEFNYDDRRTYDWKWNEKSWKKCDWAALAIHIEA